MKTLWIKLKGILREVFFPQADRCPLCGKEGGFCEDCRGQLRELLAGGDAAFYYGGIVREMIHRLKFRDQPHLAEVMGALMAEILPKDADLVTSVPLHRRRILQRGYNQSRDMAREYARILGLTYADTLLRVRNTPPQSLIKHRSQRQENIRGAFRAKSALPLSGQRILLVDDVVTTGATIEECRRELLKAGAAEVTKISFAKGKDNGNSKDLAQEGIGEQ